MSHFINLKSHIPVVSKERNNKCENVSVHLALFFELSNSSNSAVGKPKEYNFTWIGFTIKNWCDKNQRMQK